MKFMRKKINKNRKKRDASRIITGLLLGSLFGATVSLLMAPASGEEIRRRIGSGAEGVREKMKTAAGNVESKARELAENVGDKMNNVKGSVQRRQTNTYTEG
jgi:gas vesicle protein